jgi:hypothetical protein
MRDHTLEKMKSAAGTGSVILFTSAAWLTSCGAETLLVEHFYSPSFQSPNLPFVAYVPWYIGGCIHSGVNQLGGALVIAAMVAVMAETAKAFLAARCAFGSYLGALGFQLAVVWAAVVHAGAEWAGHFVSLVFTRGQRELIWWTPSETEPVWPWPTAAALAVLMVLVLRSRQEAPKVAEGQPDAASSANWGRVGWLATAWLVGFLARPATDLWFPPTGNWPHLANVAAVPWDEAGEPQSTTVRLFGPLFFALVGVLLVEIVKSMQIRRGRRAAYWPLLAFQVVLFCDVIASAAPDWAAYGWPSVLGATVTIEDFPTWPWISLLAIGLLLLPDLARRRAQNC